MATNQFFRGELTKSLIKTEAVVAVLAVATISWVNFFFPTNYYLQAGLHGLSSAGALSVGLYVTHRAYPLLRGVRVELESLRRWVLAAMVLNLLGAVTGNWIYMRYRGEGGPRQWILTNAPSFHNVMMEFKEFISLFPFPLMLSAAFILYYYGNKIHMRRDLTQAVGVLIQLSWLFLILGLFSGLVLAKLRFV
jgi:hypothetical protein